MPRFPTEYAPSYRKKNIMAKATTTKTAAAATTAPEQVVPDLAAGLAAGTVTIEAIDPQTAQLDPNIRTNPVLPEGFVDSIRAEGVREPVLARRGEDGTVYVYDGQRRLLAAREAGTKSMLAVFGIADTTGTDAGRIMDQLRSFARTDLALSDRLTAYEQLALDGISVEKIAKSAGAAKDDVAASLAVVKSESARKAATNGTESLDRLILIAEFDGDDDAVDQITWAEESDLQYVAQRIRDDKMIDKRTEEVLASYAAENITAALHWDHGTMVTLDRLTDADDEASYADRHPLDEEAHKACPGRVVVVSVNGLAEDDIHTYEVCVQSELHNLRYRGYTPAPAAVLSDEEAEAQAEAKRVERRRLIANNKAWDSAEAVRIEWVTAFLARKKLPADAAPFVAVTLTRHAYEVTNSSVGSAAKLLGIEDYSGRDALAAMVEATPTKAGHVNLAVVLAARENTTSRESWRTPNTTDTAYLLQLEKWGYHLSDVERIAAGYPEAVEAPAESESEATDDAAADTADEEADPEAPTATDAE
jgi:ParB family chromosome partitioning protein